MATISIPPNGLEGAAEIYRENILDHYKNPHNRGQLAQPTVQHKEYNTLCGDAVALTLSISGNTITDIKFLGNGCAISQAATSMLTDLVKGKSLSAVEHITADDIRGLLSIPLSPVRLKCALLSLDTLKKALQTYKETYGRP